MAWCHQAPSNYMNQWWLTVNCNAGNKFHWSFNQIQWFYWENAFENVIKNFAQAHMTKVCVHNCAMTGHFSLITLMTKVHIHNCAMTKGHYGLITYMTKVHIHNWQKYTYTTVPMDIMAWSHLWQKYTYTTVPWPKYTYTTMPWQNSIIAWSLCNILSSLMKSYSSSHKD